MYIKNPEPTRYIIHPRSRITIEEKIKNRNNWFLICIISVIVIFVIVKIILAKGQINLSSFVFSDFLALILSLFAIALSLAFYFKASETSNRFYNNTYTFTKDISETLGRIEERFGERLAHIDESYSGLREKFDRIPLDIDSAKAKEKEEEKEIKKREDEYDQIINSLLEKTEMQESEKEHLRKRLDETINELEKSRTQLNMLKHDIKNAENQDLNPQFIKDFKKSISLLLGRFQKPKSLLTQKEVDDLIGEINTAIKKGYFSKHIMQYMEDRNLIRNGKLTRTGVMLIEQVLDS